MNPMLIAAVAAQMFNLNCSGTLTTQSIVGKEVEQFATIYRLDLARGKWCDGECKHLFDFADVGPTQITFQREEKNNPPHESSNLIIFVNRETGAYVGHYSSESRLTGPMLMKWEGQCEKAPFTGWPSFNTRF